MKYLRLKVLYLNFQEILTEHDRKMDIFNIDNAAKKQRDTEKWTKFLDSYVVRLEKESFNENRSMEMNSVNPKYVLRNYVAERGLL